MYNLLTLHRSKDCIAVLVSSSCLIKDDKNSCDHEETKKNDGDRSQRIITLFLCNKIVDKFMQPRTVTKNISQKHSLISHVVIISKISFNILLKNVFFRFIVSLSIKANYLYKYVILYRCCQRLIENNLLQL